MPDITRQVTARLPDGRLLIARLDPHLAEQHSPLQRALRAADIVVLGHRGIPARTDR